MKISVIIPTHNRALVLRDALFSLEKQNLIKEDYEIIVVDNASNDNTREIAEDFKRNTKMNIIYVREERLGLHYARNSGAKAATSDILVFTDDDIDFDSKWLESILNAFESDKSVDSIGGKILIKWDNKLPSWIIPYENFLGLLDYGPEMRILRPFETINGGNFSIRKKRLFEAGGFNPEQFGDIYLGNGETGLCDKIHKAGWKIMWVPAALVWHLQIVNKNATLRDMKRRFANNGVCASYASYKEKKSCKFKLLKSSLRCFIYFGYNKISALLTHLRISNNTWYTYELNSAFYLSRALYELRLMYDKKLKRLVLKEKWLE